MAFKSYLRKNPNVFLAYQHMLLIKAETLTEFQSGITITRRSWISGPYQITVPVRNFGTIYILPSLWSEINWYGLRYFLGRKKTIISNGHQNLGISYKTA